MFLPNSSILSDPLAMPVAMTMWPRTLAASSSYLNVKPQSVGKVYSVDCAGTTISACAASGVATTAATAAPVAILRNSLRDVVTSCVGWSSLSSAVVWGETRSGECWVRHCCCCCCHIMSPARTNSPFAMRAHPVSTYRSRCCLLGRKGRRRSGEGRHHDEDCLCFYHDCNC